MTIFIDKNILNILVKAEQIEPVSDSQKNELITIENNSLNRLRKRQLNSDKEIYLNAYDRLFRHISILILEHNFQLTNYMSHQTLAKICELFSTRESVRLMISQRHKLKKNQSKLVELENITTLQNILEKFDNFDAEDCEINS